MATRANHRPMIRLTEEPVGRPLRVQHVFRMNADAAADAEHRLDEEGRLHEPAIEEVRGGVEMADVVALELESRAVAAAGAENLCDVCEGVLEESCFRASQVGRFPFEPPRAIAWQHLVQAEVH